MAERSFQRVSAQRFLERENAERGHTACFVQPNATCPVCRASVFYYQNRFGSRVFFDELGPPWPKHPCTNKQFAVSALSSGTFPVLKRRARGNQLEVAQALKTLKVDPTFPFQRAYGKVPHPVYVVRSAVRRDAANFLEAEPLTLGYGEPIFIGFMSDRVWASVDELIAFDGGTLSLLGSDFESWDIKAKQISRETFQALRHRIGEMAHEGLHSIPGPFEGGASYAPLIGPTRLPDIRADWPKDLRHSFPVQQSANSLRGARRKPARIIMSRDEAFHFETGQTKKAQFLARLRPMVRDMARNGFRKPKDVARMLNKKGVRTAAGMRWTPRLTFLLLDLLFNAAGPNGHKPVGPAVASGSDVPLPGRPVKAETDHAASDTASTMRDDLARKLSERFRVKLAR